MSLLGKLVRLNTGSVPLEDFFTEAVGHLLRTHPALCRSWLTEAGLTEARDDHRAVTVRTQRTLAALGHHDAASRIDIEIQITGGRPDAAPEVTFVESKVSAGEGAGQLRRYAEQLAALDGPANKTLLYVTRDHDPKDPEEIAGGEGGPRETAGVLFLQARWSDFYRLLTEYQATLPGAGSDLISEVMVFMEEQGMARDQRLSGADLEALSRAPRALSIMEETFADAAARLQRFARWRPKPYATGARFLREWGLYGPVCTLGPDESWQCGVGFVLNPELVRFWLGTPGSGFPAVRVFLEMFPGTTDRTERAAAMREIASRWSGWKAQNLEEMGGHAGIVRAKSLTDILSEDDHVAAIGSFFLESLAQLEEFRTEYPHLPWRPER